MNCEHYLIHVQGVTSETLAALDAGVRKSARSTWHHLDNIWLICVPHGTSYSGWNNWLTKLVQRDKGLYIFVELGCGQRFNGLLPSGAWHWINAHLHARQY